MQYAADMGRPAVWRAEGRFRRAAAPKRRAPSLLLCYPAAMSRSELVIQLVKVALGLALGAYFVWWSLQVLSRLPPQ
jgi:hypothetical protein